MGCKESKYEQYNHHNTKTILKLCKDRKQLIKFASDYRYALASAHAAYFDHLNVVRHALFRFFEDGFVFPSPSSSVTSLKMTHNENDILPGTSYDNDSDYYSNYGINYGYGDYPVYNYMKQSASRISNRIYSFNDDRNYDFDDNNNNDTDYYSSYGINYAFDDHPVYNYTKQSASKISNNRIYSFNDDQNYVDFVSNNSNHGINYVCDDYPVYNYTKQSASKISSVVFEEIESVNNRIYSFNDDDQNYGDFVRNRPDKLQQKALQSPPKVPAWDYFNLFENGGAYEYEYENESSLSSLDSREVREREGIPDLEEDTETEFSFPSSSSNIHRVSSIRDGFCKSVEDEDEENCRVKGSIPSSLSTLSQGHGRRDLRDVVREINDEFVAATCYGIEVSTLLEIGREPYRSSRSTFAKDMLTKVCSVSLTSAYSPSDPATLYPENEMYPHSLASTLDKLYAWEKKLYSTVKDELGLRLMYEKQCKRLKTLEEQGAESGKVEATQHSIRELFIKINVRVRTVHSISCRIHKLRDEELQHQLKELLVGLKKMWKLMLKCHHKQFQAIAECKNRVLRANTGLRRYSSVQATIQLQAELLKWCKHFNNWVDMQRSYALALNGWLERCIQYEPKVTSNGVTVFPFSPGRIGAPPVFILCHDWKKAMESVSELKVQTSMNDFVTCLHQLSERQNEEQHQRIKTDDIYKDFEKKNRVFSRHNENSLLLSASDSGMTTLDDLKVDLVSMRQRVKEERRCHREAVKLVHEAVSRSIQSGLIPVFESLESFTSETSKALDNIRF